MNDRRPLGTGPRPEPPDNSGLYQHALELAEARHGQELAQAETETAQPRARLSERGAHIEDLQRALAALMTALERAKLAEPTVPAQGTPGTASSVPAGEEQPQRRCGAVGADGAADLAHWKFSEPLPAPSPKTSAPNRQPCHHPNLLTATI
ncbi:hypothetical protein ACFVYE_45190 [Streptomyces sp. NPDC058239]|uniref:hypothetical protein n=1 Tax=Streptomyces sp. NPDC058239 TaxID=3346395 RepID=UPI0036F10EA7